MKSVAAKSTKPKSITGANAKRKGKSTRLNGKIQKGGGWNGSRAPSAQEAHRGSSEEVTSGEETAPTKRPRKSRCVMSDTEWSEIEYEGHQALPGGKLQGASHKDGHSQDEEDGEEDDLFGSHLILNKRLREPTDVETHAPRLKRRRKDDSLQVRFTNGRVDKWTQTVFDSTTAASEARLLGSRTARQSHDDNIRPIITAASGRPHIACVSPQEKKKAERAEGGNKEESGHPREALSFGRGRRDDESSLAYFDGGSSPYYHDDSSLGPVGGSRPEPLNSSSNASHDQSLRNDERKMAESAHHRQHFEGSIKTEIKDQRTKPGIEDRPTTDTIAPTTIHNRSYKKCSSSLSELLVSSIGINDPPAVSAISNGSSALSSLNNFLSRTRREFRHHLSFYNAELETLQVFSSTSRACLATAQAGFNARQTQLEMARKYRGDIELATQKWQSLGPSHRQTMIGSCNQGMAEEEQRVKEADAVVKEWAEKVKENDYRLAMTEGEIYEWESWEKKLFPEMEKG